MKTRVYRIALVAFNLAAALLGSIQQWGPGVGLTLAQIGVATTIGNLVIVAVRQVLDPTTPTIPPKAAA